MVLTIGHRGARGYEPENTLQSFERAIELGADMVELDVRVCGTGELVVIHDETVDRTTDGAGRVDEMSLEEIQRLDAGEGTSIPTLAEVLACVDGRAGVDIELKGEDTAEKVFEVVEQYVERGAWRYDDFLVSSFDYERLRVFQKLCPPVDCGVLLPGEIVRKGRVEERVVAAVAWEEGLHSILPRHEYVRESFVEDVHTWGMEIIPWPVNDRERLTCLKELGVDGIVTDYPDRV